MRRHLSPHSTLGSCDPSAGAAHVAPPVASPFTLTEPHTGLTPDVASCLSMGEGDPRRTRDRGSPHPHTSPIFLKHAHPSFLQSTFGVLMGFGGQMELSHLVYSQTLWVTAASGPWENLGGPRECPASGAPSHNHPQTRGPWGPPPPELQVKRAQVLLGAL